MQTQFIPQTHHLGLPWVDEDRSRMGPCVLQVRPEAFPPMTRARDRKPGLLETLLPVPSRPGTVLGCSSGWTQVQWARIHAAGGGLASGRAGHSSHSVKGSPARHSAPLGPAALAPTAVPALPLCLPPSKVPSSQNLGTAEGTS